MELRFNKMKKTLKNLLLSGTIALSMIGCSDNPQYQFKGEIAGKKIEFVTYKHYACYRTNRLTVIDLNGRKDIYHDNARNDLKIESVESYYSYNGDSHFCEKRGYSLERQKEFDSYLSKIFQIKNNLPEAPKNLRHGK